MQAVGPLLTFRSAAQEAAFTMEFNHHRLHLDPPKLRICMGLNAVVRSPHHAACPPLQCMSAAAGRHSHPTQLSPLFPGRQCCYQ